MVQILTMLRVKPLCQHRCLRDCKQPILGKILLAVTAALEPGPVEVFLKLRNWVDTLRALKQNLKSLLSPLPSTSTPNGDVAITTRITTLGAKPRYDRRLTRSTDVVIQVLV